VLIHGAYHGAWCWKDVAAGLRALGHRVVTPTWTGLGERSHLLKSEPTLETFIEDVAQVIRYEDLENVILVGHSFAGSVVSVLADRMPQQLRHLVYLDALILRSGESSARRSPERIAAYRERAMASDNPLGIPPADPMHFGITDSQQVAWLQPKLTPHPLQTYYDPLNLQHPSATVCRPPTSLAPSPTSPALRCRGRLQRKCRAGPTGNSHRSRRDGAHAAGAHRHAVRDCLKRPAHGSRIAASASVAANAFRAGRCASTCPRHDAVRWASRR
jgi:pimeloyl-ACP methyl ester carboxylesterase